MEKPPKKSETVGSMETELGNVLDAIQKLKYELDSQVSALDLLVFKMLQRESKKNIWEKESHEPDDKAEQWFVYSATFTLSITRRNISRCWTNGIQPGASAKVVKFDSMT